MKIKKIRNVILFLILICILLIICCYYRSCINKPVFNFKAYYNPPGDVAVNASDTTLAAYAWQEFLALNWKSSYSKNGMKGEPDTNWTYFSDTKTPDTIVWETFAHRTELSPYVYPMRPFDSLCNYSYQYQPQPGAGSPSYGLLNNLDETSEIGSCSLFAFTHDKNLYNDTLMVRYQAKVNRTEYNYIRKQFPTQDSLNNTVNRTSQYIHSQYGSANPPAKGLMLNLPDSSIEVKSAWRQLKASEDTSKFLTRTVIVYSKQPDSAHMFHYTNKTYALIGLHIIHKSKNHPSFVFATWEHVDVTKDHMRYVLLSNETPQTDSLGYQAPIRNPIHSIDSLATAYVHQNLLPATSVWQNYRLVGVQGTPTSDINKANFFLANYVIESDSLLSRFHGTGFSNPFNGGLNVLYNHHGYSVGGCQGCHGGGAQRTGTDFSFIVDSPNTAPDPVVESPHITGARKHPDSKSEISKLARLKQIYH